MTFALGDIGMNTWIRRIVSAVGVLAAVASAGLLVEPLWWSQAGALGFAGDALVIPETLRAGRSYDIPVLIINHASDSARVVGILEYCAGSCYSARNLPLAIPARGEARVVLHIEARTPGSFEEEVTFFTDRPSQPRLVLKVRGTIQESGDDSKSVASAL